MKSISQKWAIFIDFFDIFKTVGVDRKQESYVETHERTHTTYTIYILISAVIARC